MAQFDQSRQYDLAQLTDMLHDRRQSPRALHEIRETINRIVNQSVPITSLRERLVRATQARDTDAIWRITKHIHAIRQEETKGREF